MAWSLSQGDVVDEISIEEARAIAERIGEPIPPQVSAGSPYLRVTGGSDPIESMNLCSTTNEA